MFYFYGTLWNPESISLWCILLESIEHLCSVLTMCEHAVLLSDFYKRSSSSFPHPSEVNLFQSNQLTYSTVFFFNYVFYKS